MTKKRIGIVGYGHLGQFLTERILASQDFELCFVWNRSARKEMHSLDEQLILNDLKDFAERKPDIIVEVSHPSITAQYGKSFLEQGHYLIGSPTALADKNVETAIREAATQFGAYIPSGAFWGGDDIRRMADSNTLQGLKVTMKKHPSSFKLEGELKKKLDSTKDERVILYDGPIRRLCPMAPNNVNTMAAGAVAAHNLGFDGVNGCLVADPALTTCHVVEVLVEGPTHPELGLPFTVQTVRTNPAAVGAVTGTATFNSFWMSLFRVGNKGPGVHLC